MAEDVAGHWEEFVDSLQARNDATEEIMNATMNWATQFLGKSAPSQNLLPLADRSYS